MKKIVFLSLFLFSLFTFSCVNSQTTSVEAALQSKETIVTVDVNTFAELSTTEKGTLLDVRTPEEWADGIINGAEKINFYDEDFANQIERLNKTTPVFIYCRSGGRSSEAADILKEKGFTKIFNLDGGITSWIENKKEVVK